MVALRPLTKFVSEVIGNIFDRQIYRHGIGSIMHLFQHYYRAIMKLTSTHFALGSDHPERLAAVINIVEG